LRKLTREIPQYSVEWFREFWAMIGLRKFGSVFAAVLIGATGISAVAMPAQAQVPDAQRVMLTSDARIERNEIGADGRELTVLKKPSDVIVTPGDRVIFTLSYKNNGAQPANGFRATNPMPGPVQFVAAAEDWAEVSVDGGKSWGKLAALTVAAKAEDGSEVRRAASPEDVTHVRWVFASAIAPGAEGTISYRGVVK
jgi:uncharacterized repeat protein (TIGR01451 family)